MSFLSGSILWNLLWIIPLILIFAIAGSVRRNNLMRKMFGTDERAALFSNASPAKRVFRIILLSLAVLFLAVAAARPSWGKQVMQDTTTGRDLLVLFDVSRSMLSDDVKPSRMDHAKWLVREIVKKNPGDRFGLIAFAGESFLICPLTVDRPSFIQLVDDLDTDTIPIGGTNVQLALEEAVKAFKGAQGTHKAVILVTDGDELTGRGASVVGDLAKAQIPIFAVGVGDPSNPAVIRVKDEEGKLRILTDREGNPVKSPLNEPQLTELARRTGGIYVRSTAAYSGIDELETRIKMLERKESEDSVSMFRPIERPAYPLTAAIILLALFFCVSETRPRSLQTVLALAALLLFAIPAESRAQNAPARGQQTQAAAPADDAETTQEEPAPEPVRTASELFNSALEHQQVEHDDEKARTLYERAIAASEKEPLVRASSYQNIGVISHLDARTSLDGAAEKLQGQDLDSAGKAVDEALVKLNRAEELYRESMRSSAGDASVIRNQQILLADRKQAEEMKKQIEELKKLMEQARQQTQQAHDRQQQENQQDQQSEQQQEQDQKSGEQDQPEQQQSEEQQSEGQQQEQQREPQADGQNQQEQQSEGQQDRQQDRQSAQDMTRQAEETVSELERKASEMNQERKKQAAQQAREELQKAREEQEQGNGEKAEEHLQNALDTLNQDQQSDEQGDRDQQSAEQGEENQDEQDRQGEQDRQDRDTQQPQQANNQEMPKDQGDIDKQQAEAILNMMSKDELDFKDANQMRRSSRLNNRVEKDW